MTSMLFLAKLKMTTFEGIMNLPLETEKIDGVQEHLCIFSFGFFGNYRIERGGYCIFY